MEVRDARKIAGHASRSVVRAFSICEVGHHLPLRAVSRHAAAASMDGHCHKPSGLPSRSDRTPIASITSSFDGICRQASSPGRPLGTHLLFRMIHWRAPFISVALYRNAPNSSNYN